jgi:hypothetical protein
MLEYDVNNILHKTYVINILVVIIKSGFLRELLTDLN